MSTINYYVVLGIAEPIGSRFLVEPLFRSRTVSFGFPNPRVIVTNRGFHQFFDELFGGMTDHWFWYNRWR